MRCLIVGLALLAFTAAYEEVVVEYHDSIGIPNAARIKAEEDRIFAEQGDLQPSEGRIVGGAVSVIGAHPYLGGLVINLLSGGLSACGSSLLSQNRLVTAAHCWLDTRQQAWQFTVVLGSNWLFSGGTRIATSNVVMHPQWNPFTAPALANDVAMIYLPTNVFYSATIQPISLPSTSQLWESFAGEWAIAAGFGKTNDAQTSINNNAVISQVTVQVITVTQCQATYGAHQALDSNICTNGAGGVGICGGDSGGPLLINRWGQNILGGLVIDLTTGRLSVCVSSLLTHNRLVTATHCWRDGWSRARSFTVVLGSNWLFHGGSRVKTSRVVTHPLWKPIKLVNNIAVIYLTGSVWFSATIQPIALPSPEQLWDQFTNESATAVGFGREEHDTYLRTSGANYSVISLVKVNVISLEKCKVFYGHWARSTNICSRSEGDVSICHGYSGGPLLVNRSGQEILVGITSFMPYECQLEHPSVFTRVTSYYNFILRHLKF